jgi:hypothetical protein
MPLDNVMLAGPAAPLIIGIVLAAGSAYVSARGQYKEAKSQQKALDANARIERRNAYARERQARRSGMLAVRRQQLAIAAGGLLLEGSPLDQLAANTNEVEYQAISERNAGLNAANYMRWQGKVGVKNARRNLWLAPVTAGLMSAAGGVAGGGYKAPSTSNSTGAGLLAGTPRNTSSNFAFSTGN